MAPRNEESPFELLCPELVDRVLVRVVADKGLTLEEMAKVSQTFRDSAWRFSRKLTLTGSGEENAWRENPTPPTLQVAEGASGVDDEAVKALSEAIRLRPGLSTLVIDRKASEDLWPAIESYAWTSVMLHCVAFPPPLSGSRMTLKRFSVTLRGLIKRDAVEYVRRYLEAFPLLENLMLSIPEGAVLSAEEEDPRLRPEVQANKLSSLTFAGGPFGEWWNAFMAPPASSTNLERLSFRCYYYHPSQAPPPETRRVCSNFTRLQSLSLDIWTDHSARFLLESLTEHCHFLRHLQVFAGPDEITRATQNKEPLRLWKLVENCPDLERLVISQTEVAKTYEDFGQLALEHGIVPRGRDEDLRSSCKMQYLVMILKESAVDAYQSSRTCCPVLLRSLACSAASSLPIPPGIGSAEMTPESQQSGCWERMPLCKAGASHFAKMLGRS